MFSRHLSVGLLSLAALALPACGGDEGEFRFPVYPAGGQVLAKGKPVAKAFVRFHAVDPAKVTVPAGKVGPEVMLTTETDAEGKFALSTYLADDGVPAGDYEVTVAIGPAGPDVENGDGKPRAAPVLAKKYRDPATSTLKATVKPEGGNHFVFNVD